MQLSDIFQYLQISVDQETVDQTVDVVVVVVAAAAAAAAAAVTVSSYVYPGAVYLALESVSTFAAAVTTGEPDTRKLLYTVTIKHNYRFVSLIG